MRAKSAKIHNFVRHPTEGIFVWTLAHEQGGKERQ
jgi:hypothetical protein